MVPEAQANAQPRVCAHGIRGRDGFGVCVPCRDEQVFCVGCGAATEVAAWIRYGHRCEPCHDVLQRNLDMALKYAGGYAARDGWAAIDNGNAAVAAELRAQDRGGA